MAKQYEIANYGEVYEVQDTTVGDGHQIALCRDKKSAEFVCRACNSHQALLEACKDSLETIAKVGDGKTGCVYRMVETAIAVAEPKRE